jgi:F-type H+-transporting ATPase subunit delta
MAEAATLARPYAKAAFEAARDAKQLPAWSEALRLGAALTVDAEIADLITNPRLSLDQVVSLFAGLADQAVDAHWLNFIRLLATNKRLEVLPDILVQYEALRAQYENEIDVQVTSAVAMSATDQAKLAQALHARFKREVRMTLGIDATLLGGAVIRAGDLVIDGSVKGRLQRLSATLGS